MTGIGEETAAVLARVANAVAELSTVAITDEVLDSLPAGPLLAAALWAVDPAQLDIESRLSLVEAAQRLINAMEARRDTGIVAFVGSNPRHTSYWVDGTERHLTDARALELALALRWSEGFTQHRIACARSQAQLPATAAAFAAGLLSARTADLIADAADTLVGPVDDAIETATRAACDAEQVDELRARRQHLLAEFDSRVSDFALHHNPLRIGDKIRNTIASLDSTGVHARRAIAKRVRSNVEFRPLSDGMGLLTATLASEHALACMRVINRMATDPAQSDQDDPIGLRRADALFRCITRPAVAPTVDSGPRSGAPVRTGDARATEHTTRPGKWNANQADQAARASEQNLSPSAQNGVGVHLDVVMDLPTFLGLSDHTALLVGAGPVPADAVRDLLNDSAYVKIRRVLVDPATGHRLDTGVRRYQLTEAERDRILSRDQHCRFPDCNAPAHRCECDHAVPYDAGGASSTANLGALCKRHHQHKTHAGWRITEFAADGSCTWQSPLGRAYEHDAEPVLPSMPVPDNVQSRETDDADDTPTNGCTDCARLTDVAQHFHRLTNGRMRMSATQRSRLEVHTQHAVSAPTY